MLALSLNLLIEQRIKKLCSGNLENSICFLLLFSPSSLVCFHLKNRKAHASTGYVLQGYLEMENLCLLFQLSKTKNFIKPFTYWFCSLHVIRFCQHVSRNCLKASILEDDVGGEDIEQPNPGKSKRTKIIGIVSYDSYIKLDSIPISTVCIFS